MRIFVIIVFFCNFSRLNESKILILGMGGVGAEVAKNIILGGVKSVKLMDDAVVSELDASAQFLVPREAVGQNVSHLTILTMTSVLQSQSSYSFYVNVVLHHLLESRGVLAKGPATKSHGGGDCRVRQA